MSSPTAEARRDRIAHIVATRRDMPGALLPILHEIQDAVGYVPADALPEIARALNLSRAEVHGVVTFYHHFRDSKPGRHVIQVCRAEACQSVGSEALAAHAERVLGCGFHETTADGEFTLEPVYCLGQCACGPAVMVGEQLVGRVTPQRFDALVKACADASQDRAAEVQA
ncbi:formate dehydrogenase subunit gamma [Cupriavidus basilensis]|uniref:formate dehydrogenase subunit gamma n=1 Tax=unclassified Cupriavidus TaxID=2640874 RepID=UPI0004521A96|nr:formate dehydrogenase subunit gamma [Cupriavidus sp. SK-3]KDP88354.1 formate dehydrogenase [Cupriavidus sp. SK-3]